MTEPKFYTVQEFKAIFKVGDYVNMRVRMNKRITRHVKITAIGVSRILYSDNGALEKAASITSYNWGK
jgi:hypothetical protein